MSNDEFTPGVIFGLIVGFTAAIVMLFIAAFATSLSLAHFVEKFQTLITGVGALIVGIVTVHFLHRQITQANSSVASLRYQKLRSARAALPKALSDLSAYASACIEHFMPVYTDETGQGVTNVGQANRLLNAPLPTLDDNIIDLFRDIIENTDDNALFEKLSVVLRRCQTQRSSLQDYEHRKRSQFGIVQVGHHVRDALEIHAHASSLFEYARFETDKAPPPQISIEQIRRSAFLSRLYPDTHPRLFEKFEREYL